MLEYIPGLPRRNQGKAHYCALASLEMTQAYHGAPFHATAPVPCHWAKHGIGHYVLMQIFRQNSYLPINDTGTTFTSPQIRAGLRRFGPLIATLRTTAIGGHVVVVFGVDMEKNRVMIRDPARAYVPYGNTSHLEDATIMSIEEFNRMLPTSFFGPWCLVGHPGASLHGLRPISHSLHSSVGWESPV